MDFLDVFLLFQNRFAPQLVSFYGLDLHEQPKELRLWNKVDSVLRSFCGDKVVLIGELVILNRHITYVKVICIGTTFSEAVLRIENFTLPREQLTGFIRRADIACFFFIYFLHKAKIACRGCHNVICLEYRGRFQGYMLTLAITPLALIHS